MTGRTDWPELHAKAVVLLKRGETYDPHQIAELLGVATEHVHQWWVAVDGIDECATVVRNKRRVKLFRAGEVRGFLGRKAAEFLGRQLRQCPRPGKAA